MKIVERCLVAGVMIVVLAGVVMVGCETTTSEDNVITVSPATAVLTNDYATQVFTASFGNTNGGLALVLPLQWSVSHPERGTIKASGSMMAIYQATRLGDENLITVRDQGDNEGTAIVVKE